MTVPREIGTAPLGEEIAEILITSAGVSPEAIAGSGECQLADLGLDSLAAMELQAIVKDRYQVQIPDESLTMTIAEIARFVTDQRGEAV